MGNCQAIDNASLIIQHPGGRSEMLYWPISASEVMKLNPGHYVALLLTTTLYTSPATVAPSSTTTAATNQNNQPLRVTRIKLLRSTDMLTLGHAYRLITTQEVMKGLWEKKHGKKMRNGVESEKGVCSDFEKRDNSRSGLERTSQVRRQHEKHGPRTSSASASASASKGWHPTLNSISEASS